jgi:hypothetical protein
MNFRHTGVSFHTKSLSGLQALIILILLLIMISMVSACMPSYREKETPHSPEYCLTIRQYPGMALLAAVPMTASDIFSLSFIHSVTRTPVQDIYRIESGGICQTSEIFESHCAGLPYSDQETNATRWKQQDGKFILHMERKIPRLVVRTDRNYKNRLHLPDRVIDLNQWEDQALLLDITPAGTCR